MNTIGLVFNRGKGSAAAVAREVVSCLHQRKVQVLMLGEEARAAGVPELETDQRDLVRRAQCLLSLGGDGTLLSAAHLALQGNLPLLGVNLGQLGFLTEVEVPELHRALDALVSDNYDLERRMILQADLHHCGDKCGSFWALNDLVLARGAFARLIEISVFVEEDFVVAFPADGLIVSTPTGSTAYSLAAGGPIVVPSLDVTLLTPICPHTFHVRPLVIEAKKHLRMIVTSPSAEAMLAVDGQHAFTLRPEDEVLVTKAPVCLNLIRLGGHSFFEVMRHKLHLGNGKGSGGTWPS